MPTDQIVDLLLKMLPPLELLRIAEMPEASRLAGLSADTLAREYGDKIVRLSKRRKGMRVVHALMVPVTAERALHPQQPEVAAA
jgi:hypothetical protein